MHPSVCPLCRKPFIPDRSKKLITGEGEEEDKTAIELLQRLVVSWDTDMTEEQRVALVTEIEAYLGAGNTVSNLLLDVFRQPHELYSMNPCRKPTKCSEHTTHSSPNTTTAVASLGSYDGSSKTKSYITRCIKRMQVLSNKVC